MRRVLTILSLALLSCGPRGNGRDASPPPAPTPVAAPQPSADEARAFLADVNRTLRALGTDVSRVMWVKQTYIIHDTELMATQANERFLEYITRKAREAKRFDGLALDADSARQLYLLKYAAGLPAPTDPTLRAELAQITTEMESTYSKGKVCSPRLKGKGEDKTAECLPLGEIEKLMAESRDPTLLFEVWKGWHAVAPPLRAKYQRFVELGNRGAVELGFGDMGQIWRGGYDMSADAFVTEMDRLWQQVKPLYQELHCYTRARLNKIYGDKVPTTGPIPAHLLGNMWAQEWSNLYKELVPYPGVNQLDLTPRLVQKKYDAHKMVKTGEQFFTSLGMQALPESFWERSLFVKPKDRDVECHASAWDITGLGDVRIKMCVRINQEDFVTVHHELGHNYYFLYYKDLIPLYQAGANDGFHEGIGDTLALSVTPDYLTKIGLLDGAVENERADLNLLMHRALDGVAFLPFGKLIDEWRWRVFNGQTPFATMNQSWWQLRLAYQGVAPPEPRGEESFDPGAKFHIPANVPYTRYFIARILQYQFHRALCRLAGHNGPLHRCSIYDSKPAGERLMQMLRLGASRPWPEALAVLSGETQMDASAIIDYYAPLMAWLKTQNKGQTCGW